MVRRKTQFCTNFAGRAARRSIAIERTRIVSALAGLGRAGAARSSTLSTWDLALQTWDLAAQRQILPARRSRTHSVVRQQCVMLAERALRLPRAASPRLCAENRFDRFGEHSLVLLAQSGVAFARVRSEPIRIGDVHAATAILDHPLLLQLAREHRHARALHTQHLREVLSSAEARRCRRCRARARATNTADA